MFADFNCSPEGLIQLGWPRFLCGQVVCTREATISTGSVLDYAIVSKDLEGILSLEVCHEVPWKPHYGIIGHLEREALVRKIPTLTQVSLQLHAGPRPDWGSFMCHNEATPTLNDGYMQWCTQAERYLRHTDGSSMQGLGQRPHIAHVSRVTEQAIDQA